MLVVTRAFLGRERRWTHPVHLPRTFETEPERLWRSQDDVRKVRLWGPNGGLYSGQALELQNSEMGEDENVTSVTSFQVKEPRGDTGWWGGLGSP